MSSGLVVPPITAEILREFFADPTLGWPHFPILDTKDAKFLRKELVKALTEVVRPLLTPWAGPEDIDTNPDRLSGFAPRVLQWLFDVLPKAVLTPFSGHSDEPEGEVSRKVPYWVLQLTRAVLQWHIKNTPVNPVFGDPSDAFGDNETARKLWFALPEVIKETAPFPALLPDHLISGATFTFYEARDDAEVTPPWVEDFGAPGVRQNFFLVFEALLRPRGDFLWILTPRVRSHTCRLLSRLIVKVGAKGRLELAVPQGKDADLACKILTEGLAALPADDPARDMTKQALALLTSSVVSVGSLKRAREE